MAKFGLTRNIQIGMGARPTNPRMVSELCARIGWADDRLRKMCKKTGLSRVKVIRKYGDPREWYKGE